MAGLSSAALSPRAACGSSLALPSPRPVAGLSSAWLAQQGLKFAAALGAEQWFGRAVLAVLPGGEDTG